MKKALSLLLSLLIIFSLFACGGTPEVKAGSGKVTVYNEDGSITIIPKKAGAFDGAGIGENALPKNTDGKENRIKEALFQMKNPERRLFEDPVFSITHRENKLCI